MIIGKIRQRKVREKSSSSQAVENKMWQKIKENERNITFEKAPKPLK